MVLENNGRNPETLNPGLDSVAVFLGDVILIATGHPDQEGESEGDSCLVLLPLSDDFRERLATLPVC